MNLTSLVGAPSRPDCRSIIFALTLLLPLMAFAPQGSAATTHNVAMVNTSFSPSQLTIQTGDTVRWTNQDLLQHTTTSGNVPTPNGLWGSAFLNNGGMFSRTFNSAGTFPYFCTPHTFSMTGSITVQPAPNVLPTVSIDSPSDDDTFIAPAMVTIQASANDPDGFVTQVQFFDGALSLGVDTMSPYEISPTLDPGSHGLAAVVTDNRGATATSATVRITVHSPPIDNPIAERIAKGTLRVELRAIAGGLASPLGMATPDDGSDRLFVFDQSGLVWVLTPSGLSPIPLLDIRARLVTLGPYDERGLLGLAVHPDFADNPLVYTYTSEPVDGPADFTVAIANGTTFDHQSVVAEWRLSPTAPNQLDPASRREILRIDQPQFNHNGGALHFGPDDLLYISLGDGGAADDEGNGHGLGGNGQNPNTILGSVLRIDVNGADGVNGQYGVPADNPFVSGGGLREIFAIGFRNPYSFSFDRLTGDLYLGDVGQNKIEEINRVTIGGNYGWNHKEGTFYFNPNGDNPGFVTDSPVGMSPPDLIDPIAQYDHDDGLAVVGGYVYRGSAIPELQGRYVFGDWGSFGTPSGRLFYLDAANTVAEFIIGLEDRPLGHWVKGFGQGADGELYVFVSQTLGPSGNTGKIFKFVPAPAPLEITEAQTSDTDLNISWSGGTGPFALQRKPDLSDPFCGVQTFTAASSLAAPLIGSAGFFRVADTAGQPPIPMTTYMSGMLERPDPLDNTATGSGTFSVDGDLLAFDIQYAGLSGVAIGAHIHGPAPASMGAPVLINLAPYNGTGFGTQGTLSGTLVLTPEQKAIILSGLAYVNVHTMLNQGGEVRGQIAPVLMQACLNGANERPDPILTSGTGSGLLALAGNQLAINLTYRSLTGMAIAAHLHGPADLDTPAGVLIGLDDLNVAEADGSGSIQGLVTLTDEQLAYLIDGRTYINLHTPLHVNGEIRGQIVPLASAAPLTTHMSGLLERPDPLMNSATGSGTFLLEGNILGFEIYYEGLSGPAIAAHIHGYAPASAPAGVVFNLAPYHVGDFSTSGRFSGALVLTPEQKAGVLSGLTYVNIHTDLNSGGEMRGQIAAVLMRTGMAGANERPDSVATTAAGTGLFTLVRNQLRMNVTYGGLSGPAGAGHIHGPASIFQPADVLINLDPYNGGAFGSAGSLFGPVPLLDDHLAALIDGLTYINLHTIAHGTGEIRGQIQR